MSGEQQLKQMIHADEAIFLIIIYKPFFLEVTVIFFFSYNPDHPKCKGGDFISKALYYCIIKLQHCILCK
jgi:hypothetical protein